MATEPDPLDFSGRTVLVTGGTKGVGHGIAERFRRAGATVVVTARTAPDSPARHGDAVALFTPADLREPDQAGAAVAFAVEAGGGRIHTLVDNAGGRASGRRGRRVAEVLRIDPRARAAGPAARVPGGRRDHAAPARRRIDHQHRQREWHTTVAGKRRVRGVQGRAGRPDPVAGRRVGREGAARARQRRSHPHRAGPPGLRRRGRDRPGRRHRPARPDGQPRRHRRRLPVPRLADGELISGANLVVHGGGKRPASLGAAAGD